MVLKQKANIPQATSETLETLRELCKPHLLLNKARLTCFLMLVLAVIKQRTVSLVWLSKNTESSAQASSIYRRFQRFFALCDLPPKTVGRLVLALAPKPKDGWILAMDRTNWQFGKSHINILVVTVIVAGVGYPIAWRVLPKSTKKGNSRKFHRTAVMDEVLEILPAEEIKVLTMDREFVGKKWLGWLKFMGISYIVRVKKNARIGSHHAVWLSVRGRWKKYANEEQKVFGQSVYFAAKRIPKGREKYLAVISHGFQGDEALALYWQRWGIETLFGHLKKRGYQFEDTHLTKRKRVEKLFGVLAVAFALCHRQGRELEQQTGKVERKKHGYRAKSVFRKGFESLHQMLVQPNRFAEQLATFFRQTIQPLLQPNFVA